MISHYRATPLLPEIITVVPVRLHGVDYHVHLNGRRKLIFITYAGRGEPDRIIGNHRSGTAQAVAAIALRRALQ